MTDEQFKDLIQTLKPAEKSLVERVVDQTVPTLIAAVLLGFFALLWSYASESREKLRNVDQLSAETKVQITGAQRELTAEIAKLATRVDGLVDVQDALAAQVKAQAARSDKPMPPGARDELPGAIKAQPPVTAPIPTDLGEVARNRKISDEFSKAVSDKSVELTKRIDDYRQQAMPRK
jgi:hypothetical protein